ncbi:MAG: polysaccharide biosynthesis tyrosine autokinase [Leptolyngbyaceae cyanobacterium RM1_1_2]|nr:polysaccharide biosynthesis tyrosine autokinase [Leptolyngbyaceae cyanobacterium RM1_1_2]
MESKATQEETTAAVEQIDLRKYWLVLKRRWWAAAGTFVLPVAAATALTLSEEPVYRASGQLLLQVDRSASLTGVGQDLSDFETVSGQTDPLKTQAALLRSPVILQEVAKSLDIRNSEGELIAPDAIARSLNVEALGDSDVLVLSYTSDEPDLAVAIVNQVMETYVDKNVLANRATAAAAREFLADEKPIAQAAAEQAAEDIRQFKTDNQVIALDQEVSTTLEAISTLSGEINEAQARLAELESRSGELQRQLNMSPQQAATASTLSQAPGIQQVLTDLQTAQTELASQQALYTQEYPVIQNLQRQVDSLNALLQERVAQVLGQALDVPAASLQMVDLQQDLTSQLLSIEIERLSLLPRVSSLIETRSRFQQRANAFPSLEKQQRNLERQLETATSIYESLESRLQEASIAENQSIGTAQIIEAALGPTVIAADNKKLLVAGAVAGVFLGIAVAFFLDLVDRTVKTVQDAESLFGYTLLGVIPKFSTEAYLQSLHGLPPQKSNQKISPRIVALDAYGAYNSFVYSAYQMLQANLKFMSSDKKNRAIAITSSIPQEGKSEVSANLAATLAQNGSRVLLVDADMRSPSQHHLWGLVNAVGLSHVLVGEGTLAQGIQAISNNLFVLTAGIVPPNPLALIDSERMKTLIQGFLREYDYVVFDTPPLAGIADAAVLGTAVDGVLLLARTRFVDSASAIAAKSLLARSGANVLGLVANGVDTKDEPNSIYAHYARAPEEYRLENSSGSESVAKLPNLFSK